MLLNIAKIRAIASATKRRVYAKIVAPVVPALVGTAEGLPVVDPELLADEAGAFICDGPVEIFLAMMGGFLALNTLCMVTRGKQIKSLPLEEQKNFFIKAFDSKLWALRGLSVLAGLPVKVVYYNQTVVADSLGYNRAELCEDALKHMVSRDSQPASVDER